MFGDYYIPIKDELCAEDIEISFKKKSLKSKSLIVNNILKISKNNYTNVSNMRQNVMAFTGRVMSVLEV